MIKDGSGSKIMLFQKFRILIFLEPQSLIMELSFGEEIAKNNLIMFIIYYFFYFLYRQFHSLIKAWRFPLAFIKRTVDR